MIDSLLSRTEQGDSTGGQRPDDGADADASDAGPRSERADTEFDAAHEAGEGLPLDVTFEILKNRRRRLILEYLEGETDPMAIGELAEHIAAIENDIDVRQLDSQQRKRVYIGLYQCHLPKMDDAGVIEYNQTRGLVELNDKAAPLYDYFDETEPEQPDTDGRQYLFLTALFGVAFFTTQLASVPMVTNLVVIAFCIGMLSLAALESRTESAAE